MVVIIKKKAPTSWVLSDCMDYDGMGNYGRFPNKGTIIKKKRIKKFLKKFGW